MPTQEERLRTVEYDLKQFKTETIKAYGETAIERVNTRLDRVETMLTQILARLPENPKQ